MLQHVMMSLSHTFPASFDSDKFGRFGGAIILSFMVDRGDFFEHVDGEFLNESADFWVDCHCLLSFASEGFTCLSKMFFFHICIYLFSGFQ